MATRLSRLGYTVKTVRDGRELLSEWRTARPRFDLMMIDIDMPVCDGISALREIREDDQATHAVLMSGSSSFPDRATLGAQTRLLRKPFKSVDLISTLESFASPALT